MRKGKIGSCVRPAIGVLAALLLHLGLHVGDDLVRAEEPPADPVALQSRVDDLRARLALPARVLVSVVPVNRRVVSVAPPDGADAAFKLAIERHFLDVLTDDELSAALAHELGHVWVFTHHPYLQTERLANDIAMRVVTRDSLERVYEKLWARNGTKGDLLHFLGPASSGAALAAVDTR